MRVVTRQSCPTYSAPACTVPPAIGTHFTRLGCRSKGVSVHDTAKTLSRQRHAATTHRIGKMASSTKPEVHNAYIYDDARGRPIHGRTARGNNQSKFGVKFVVREICVQTDKQGDAQTQTNAFIAIVRPPSAAC